MTGTADDSDFQKYLKLQSSLTSRTQSEVLNRTGLDIANFAYKLTPVGSREKIQADLGASVVSTRVNKKGKTVRRYKYTPTPVVYLIVNGQRKRKGLPPIHRADMKVAARKLIAGRLRAINSLKSGWVGTIRDFIRVTRQGSIISDSRPVKQKGYAVPAKQAVKAVAELVYRLTIKKENRSFIDPRVETALADAFRAKTADMKGYCDRKLAEQFKKEA